jgi:ankyrin repeat protein
MNAAKRENEEVVKILLDHDDIKTDIRNYNYCNGWTAIVFAVAHGHEAVVRLLLERDNASIDRALILRQETGMRQ